MLRTALATAGVATLVATSLCAAGPAQAASDVFRGTWTSIDTDGSNQTLTIGGSGMTGRHSARLFDDSATSACGGAPAMLLGSGLADGDVLVTTGVIVCLPGGNNLRFRISVEFFYDSDTDTMTDQFGVEWERA